METTARWCGKASCHGGVGTLLRELNDRYRSDADAFARGEQHCGEAYIQLVE